MHRILSDYEPHAYAVMRILIGVMFLCHGLQKAVGAFGGVNGAPAPLFSLIGIAGWLEVILGLMIALGVFTELAAFLASGEMAFAYFIGHFSRGFFPLLNGGTAAILFCFACLYLSTSGGGPISLDAMLRKKN